MNANHLQKKIEDIRGAGLTYVAIAKRAGCDISTLFRIRQGAILDPAYSVGSEIDRMHAQVTAADDLPPAA
jgi:predicted transcriptional regulator